MTQEYDTEVHQWTLQMKGRKYASLLHNVFRETVWLKHDWISRTRRLKMDKKLKELLAFFKGS